MSAIRGQWRTLDDTSLCAAFQRTAAEIPDRVALRTVGDGVTVTWREYAQRVESIAGGLASAGIGDGDVVALMLTNRPEHCLVDTAAMHLGCSPFSIYATCPVEDVAWLLEKSGARIVATEPAFIDRVSEAAVPTRLAPAGRAGGGRGAGRADPGRSGGCHPARRVRFRRTLAGRRSRPPDHADLHLGHHWSAQGRHPLARLDPGGLPEPQSGQPGEPRWSGDVVPADGAHRRALHLALLVHGVRLHDHHRRRSQGRGRRAGRRAPDSDLHRPAPVREALRRPHRSDRGRDRPGQAQGDGVGRRHGSAQGARRTGRRGHLPGVGRGVRQGR